MYETECPYCEKNVKLEIDLEGDYKIKTKLLTYAV